MIDAPPAPDNVPLLVVDLASRAHGHCEVQELPGTITTAIRGVLVSASPEASVTNDQPSLGAGECAREVPRLCGERCNWRLGF